MSKPSLVIVLSEDWRQQTFVRSYLERAGFTKRQIRSEPLPSGKGSGEQWVRQRYAKNVAAYRSRVASASTALVVVIDADTGEMTQRHRELDQALLQDNLTRRTNEEKIAHLIPKRNIETWILCLNGRDVDEVSDYRHQEGIDQQIKPAAAALFVWSRRNAAIPTRCVLSLRAAVAEVKRLGQ